MLHTTTPAGGLAAKVDGGHSDPVTPGWLPLALWTLGIVWGALLFGGFVVGWPSGSHTSHIPAVCRIGSSVVLAIAGWVATIGFMRTSAARYALLIAIGMTFGLLGDLFMAGMVIKNSDNGPLGGMASFGLGHIAYIAACLELRRRAKLTAVAPLRGALIGWELFGLLGWFVVVWLGAKNGSLRIPALPYCLLLAGTAGFTSGLALQARSLIGLGLGGALFLISDLILAFPMFRGSFFMSGDAVWLTYGPGQMLIVFSIPAAVRLIHAVEQRQRDAAL